LIPTKNFPRETSHEISAEFHPHFLRHCNYFPNSADHRRYRLHTNRNTLKRHYYWSVYCQSTAQCCSNKKRVIGISPGLTDILMVGRLQVPESAPGIGSVDSTLLPESQIVGPYFIHLQEPRPVYLVFVWTTRIIYPNRVTVLRA